MITTLLPTTNLLRVNNAYTEFEYFLYSSVEPYVSNPILVGTPPRTNTCPAGILVDPLDATKKLFWRGEFDNTGGSLNSQIGLFEGSDVDDPYDLGTRYGTVIAPGATEDVRGCRFGMPVFISGTDVWYYYVGLDIGYNWTICRAVSTDGGRTYTKMGIVLSPNGTDEFGVSGPAIYREGGTWYMGYTCWSGPVNSVGITHDPGASSVGIRLATSSDGITWTKAGVTLVPLVYDRVEDSQFYKIGDKYVLLYNVYKAAGATTWSLFVSSNTVPNTTFTVQKPFKYVYGEVRAVGFLFTYSDGFTYVYYQQEDPPPGSGIDNIYVAKLIPPN